ncbi:MAG: YbjN domain-containing protein [Chloroflexota bacterium]
MGYQQIFNSLIEFFEEDGWDFQWMAGMSILNLSFIGENGEWSCYAQAREFAEQFVFYSAMPEAVPENKRHRMAEFITRANFGMIIGNFEMDYADGELRFKTSVDVEGSELSPPLIRQTVYANLVITDRYLPGIREVIHTDNAPLDILNRVELMEEFEDTFENDAFEKPDDDTSSDDPAPS